MISDLGGCPPPFSLQPNLQSIRCWFEGCCLEEVLGKIEKDKSKFACDLQQCLNKMSPLSLKVTFRQINEAASLCLDECFNVDYRIALRMICKGDFKEG